MQTCLSPLPTLAERLVDNAVTDEYCHVCLFLGSLFLPIVRNNRKQQKLEELTTNKTNKNNSAYATNISIQQRNKIDNKPNY
mmetsp:Transcript_19926/g.56442  ORF Transcript_19926/g.56442 Transcript_19926/m.56442 type:complete len:82 (-) Transcript_19926:4-249(-)